MRQPFIGSTTEILDGIFDFAGLHLGAPRSPGELFGKAQTGVNFCVTAKSHSRANSRVVLRKGFFKGIAQLSDDALA